MKNIVPASFTFPVGYHRFHRKQFYTFQLNRWYSPGCLLYDDVKAAGTRIKKFGDWKPVMLDFAERKRGHSLIKSLVNARLVKDVVFIKQGHAGNHCSIGNIKLSLDTMIEWLAEKGCG